MRDEQLTREYGRHGGHVLLRSANVARDAGVVDASEDDAFIAAAKTRQWDREKAVRTLA